LSDTSKIAITTHGSDFYFAICAAMGVAGFAFLGLAFRKNRRDRVFHYITAAVVFVACIAYFTMGSNLGWTPIAVEYQRSNPVGRGTQRSIYYVRYIDWFITTPLLLLDLLLTAGMPWPTILWVMLVDEIMIITGLVGALVASRYKWAYFVFGKFPSPRFNNLTNTPRLLRPLLHRLPARVGIPPPRRPLRRRRQARFLHVR
jgi:bacteriorhodopsin